jgi:hypothetical protein
MLLDSATFCPYCGATDMSGTAKPANKKPAAPVEADDDDESSSTMVMQVTPEMMKAAVFAKAAPPKPAAVDPKATMMGLGLPDLQRAAPKESEPKKTIMGLGLADIVKAQEEAAAKAATPESKPAPAPPRPAAPQPAPASREAKATIMGLGLSDIVKAQQQATANDRVDELQPQRPPAPQAPMLQPIDLEPDEAFSEETTDESAVSPEFHPVDGVLLRLSRELPGLENDVETMQFLPPTGGLFSLFAYAKHASRVRAEIADLRDTLKQRRTLLTNEKKKAYQRLGQLGWMKGLRIVGLDSYVSELSFFKDQLDTLEQQKATVRAGALGSQLDRHEADQRNLSYLEFEVGRPDTWREETQLLEHKVRNLTHEIEYLRGIIARVTRPDARGNLENLLKDREFLLENAGRKQREISSRAAQHAERAAALASEFDRLRARVSRYSVDLDRGLAPLEREEREILGKIAPSLEKMGEVIAASQAVRGDVHKDLKQQVEVVTALEEWLQRENLFVMKLKDIEGRVDVKRVGQARIFLASLILLGVGFAGVATLVALYLAGVIS